MIKSNSITTKITSLVILLTFSILLTGCQMTFPAVEESTDEPAVAPVSNEPASSTADWQVYTNEDYRFELKYPKEASWVENPPVDMVLRAWLKASNPVIPPSINIPRHKAVRAR